MKAWKTAEIDVARSFSAMWEPVKFPRTLKCRAEDLPFRRTPSSGAWGGFGGSHKSDLIGPETFPFGVEIKAHNKGWTWDAILKDKCKVLDDWWKQSVASCKKSGKIPLLVFRRNKCPWYICMSREVFDLVRHKLPEKGVVRITTGKYVFLLLDAFTSNDATSFKRKGALRG